MRRPSIIRQLPFQLHDLQGFQISIFITDEFLSSQGPLPFTSFFMGRGCFQNHGECRPGHKRRSVFGRLGHQFKLCDLPGTLAVGGSHAIASRITAANDDHFLACRKNVFIRYRNSAHPFILLFQELHRKINASEIPARNRQVPGNGGTATEHNGVVVMHEFVDTQVHTHIGIAAEFNAFLFQYIDSPVNYPFFQFKIRDTISQ